MSRRLSRRIFTVVLGVALLIGPPTDAPAQQATPAGVPGNPGQRAEGAPISPHKLVANPNEPGPVQTRVPPRMFPVDQATFGQMKAEANRLAAAEHRPDGDVPGPSTAPTPQFATLDMSGGGGWNPPDGALAVGPTSGGKTTVLVSVNEAFAVYKSDGTQAGTSQVLGPVSLPAFFGTTDSTFDPKALYDKGHGRFVLVATKASRITLAVSQNSSPEAPGTTWCRYDLNPDPSGSTWADYPGLGMDGDNLYITSNQFSNADNGFRHAQLLVVSKATVYPESTTGACPSTTPTLFGPLQNPGNSGAAFTVQPADQPDASPGQTGIHLVNAIWASGQNLAVRSVSKASDGRLALSGAYFVQGGCIAHYKLPADAPQPSGRAIDTGDTRLLGAVHRNGKIYTGLTSGRLSSCNLSGSNAYANVQWYEITPATSSSPSFGASYVVSHPQVAYFFPGVLPGSQFVGLQFSGSGSRQPASAFVARGGGNPAVYATGVRGYQRGNRWGDYPAVAADPGDPAKIWVLGEYAKTTTTWGTAVTTVP